jgi:hypothetical protein
MIAKNTCFKAEIDSKAILALPKRGHRATRTGPDHDDGVGVHIHFFILRGKMDIRMFSILLRVLIRVS